MKKILLIFTIIIIYIIILYFKLKLIITSKVNLNYNEDEIILTILNGDDTKAILVNKTDLIVISYIDDYEIKKLLEKYNIKILNNIITEQNIELRINSYNKYNMKNVTKLNNLLINKNENIIKLQAKENVFCIYEKGINKELSNCDYIWFLEVDEIDFKDETKVIFYDNSITIEETEKFYDKWVDSYMLESKYVYKLKFNEKNYDIEEIDITKK